MAQFEMAVEPYFEGVRVALRGELDVAYAYTFDARLREVERRRPRLILIDLRNLHFLDSAGMARILAAHRRARRENRRVLLTRASRPVQRVLALAALDTVFEFASDAQLARATL
jgi:anti-anti-sigma factor